MTLVTAITALGIFQHGGFGPPHVVAVLTLVALAVGTVASRGQRFGRASRYVQAVSYSSTVLFHLIPGRHRIIDPLAARSAPGSLARRPVLQGINLVLLGAFLVGATLQGRWLANHGAHQV